MRNVIICLVVFSLFMSCSNTVEVKKPDNLISKEKMSHILIDMSLLASAKGVNKSKIEKKGIVPEAYIYSKHQIDSLQFVASNNYYANHLEEYLQIIKEATDSLIILNGKYNSLAKKDAKAKKIKDSIKRASRTNKKRTLKKAPKKN